MELAQQAMVARYRGELEQAEALAFDAYKYEAQAADLVPYGEPSEPTRSILYRSAASLAYQCKELQAAQRLVAKGLSGYPPPDVEHELKTLYEQVKFEYYLQERSARLEDEDLELSMQGDAVGSGMIFYDAFIKRIERTKSLIDRTVQRLSGREYQLAGRVAEIYKPFVPALSVPRAGSFAITFKLLSSIGQIPLLFDAAQVIDQLISGMEFINDLNESGLRAQISDEGYYRHFVSMAREIAPDEEKISLVGFTSSRRTVRLSRRRSDIVFPSDIEATVETSEREPISVEGILDYAKSRAEDVIGLTTKDNRHYMVQVREGLEDLVKAYFGDWVIVTGMLEGSKIHLIDLQAQDG